MEGALSSLVVHQEYWEGQGVVVMIAIFVIREQQIVRLTESTLDNRTSERSVLSNRWCDLPICILCIHIHCV